MKKRINVFISLILVSILVTSCYKEEDRDIYIVNSDENVDSRTTYQPDTFYAPCYNSLDVNTFYFDGIEIALNSEYSRELGWTSNLYSSGNAFVATAINTSSPNMGGYKVYFSDADPLIYSKIYDVSDSRSLDENSVFITYQIGIDYGYGTQYYNSVKGGKLYFNKLGDSISISFCDIDFVHSDYSSFTAQGSCKIAWTQNVE